MSSQQDKDRYLIEGRLGPGLWKFAAPFMLAYVLQALYGAVDVLVVGQFCNAGAVSAVGIGAQAFQLVLGSLYGLCVGGTVLIGFNLGAKDERGTANAIGATAALFAVVAIILTPTTALLTRPLVSLMQTPPEAFEYACQYVFICACGIPFIIGYNVISAIYRGFGDAVRPMYFVAVACVANIIGDVILIGDFHFELFGQPIHVGGFNLGPAGAAYATAGSQALSFFCALFHARRRRFPVDFHRTNFIPRRKEIVSILKVGIPLSLQDFLTGTSFLVILAIVNLMGVLESAGMAVAERIVGFMFMPPVAFSSAVATATSQNFGAQKYRRAFKAMVMGGGFALIFGFASLTLSQVFPANMSAIFSSDPQVVEQSSLYLRSFSFDCLLVSLVFAFNGYFCGASRAVIVSVHSILAAVLFRIPLSYLFSKMEDASLYEVGFAAPLASLFSILLCSGYFFYLYKTKKLQLRDVPNPETSEPPKPETV